MFVVGKSYQGRPIWAAKVSDNVAEDENEPEVLFDALHHAREHLTIEQILDTFGQLTAATTRTGASGHRQPGGRSGSSSPSTRMGGPTT